MTRIRVPLGKFIKEYSERNKGNEDIPVYSVTNSQGFCTEYFGKEVASQDKTTYKIVPQGYFAYNPSRINVGSVDWQRYEKRVIVSPLYNVFSVSEGIDRQYLYYFLRSDLGRQMIKAKASGSVRDNLKLDMLKEMTIPDISVEQQKFCSSVLDKLHKLIQMRQQELQKLDEFIKAEFVEDGGVPEHIPPERINKYIFNVDTVDRMISDLMNNGIRHKNGNHVGKTIIFAQNKLHAKFIVDRFNELYPQYKGNFCKLVVCDEPYAGQNLKDFKKADDYPFITVTVDMLETGIDVPEITNLVFAKKVYSRIKFEQMLGRGTRLCENLFGEGEDKKEFVVFDYMRNFQFFDEHPKGREAGEVVAPVAARFIRMVQMIKCLQDANYVDVKYQNIRENLIDHVVDDVKAMGTERVEVRLELRYVERYKERKQYECLEEIHKEEIIDHLAKLVVSDEKDEAAISFDVLMYGLMLSVMTGGKNLGRLKRYVVGNANILLKECATIPDIKVRISELKELVSDHYWDVQDVLKFEETRKSLREIMKYIPAKKEKLHYSNFKDIVVFREEGRLTSLSASDFEDYRAKVNEYVEAHKTTPAINKLLHNEPISVEDYNELERIFTVELGTAEDYEMNYQDTPFGLLIRKIAKMDRTAAYAAFSTFILEERPNTEQLHFIEQVVDYVVENGYINNVLDLMKTPFDRPYKFSLIFTYEEQVKFVKIINNIKNNALVT